MSVTLKTPQPSDAMLGSRVGFVVNANSADLSGCEVLRDAPGAKRSIYIESIVISTDTALNVSIGAGETANAITEVMIGPLYFPANGRFEWVFCEPLKLDANTALTASASGAGNVTLIVEGFEG
jgi:hypothetical protein